MFCRNDEEGLDKA